MDKGTGTYGSTKTIQGSKGVYVVRRVRGYNRVQRRYKRVEGICTLYSSTYTL